MALISPKAKRIRQFIDALLEKNFPHTGGFLNRDATIDRFKRRNERLKSIIPHDRLLVFKVRCCPKIGNDTRQVSDGWGPLCKFLDMPVPDVPFPNVNDSKQFASTLEQNNFAISMIVLAIVASTLVCGALLGPLFGVLLFLAILLLVQFLDSLAISRIKLQ
jgi:hypothetical protein